MATDDFDEENEDSLLRKCRVRWTGAGTKAGQPPKAAPPPLHHYCLFQMSGARGSLRKGRGLGALFFVSMGGATTGAMETLTSFANVKFFAPDMWNIGCCLFSVRSVTSCEMKSPSARTLTEPSALRALPSRPWINA